MTVAIESANAFTELWAEFLDRTIAHTPAWLAERRREGLARFTELGIPTTRDEDWRFTSLAPLTRTRFGLAPAERPPVPLTGLNPFQWAPADAPCLVFVNGRLAPPLSHLQAPRGVQLASLASTIAAGASEPERHLAEMPDDAGTFVALNTAFLEDGAFVQIAADTVVETPIHLIYIALPGDNALLLNSRTLISVGPRSQCTIVESYFAETGTYFQNAVTQLIVGEEAVVDHYKVQRESLDAFHIGTLQLDQQRASQVRSHCLSLGGSLVRHNINAWLGGEGGDCHLNGLYLVGGSQHVDNHLRVAHAAPHCSSREIFKGILDGRSRGVFTGRIIVHKGAQQTDGKQTNHNLLLSDEAQVQTKPQLEIFADDVKCTHGATIGQLDADAIFYLRSRGIPESAARSLLTYAFAAESLDQIRIAALRAHIERLVRQRLPQGELLEDHR